MKSIKDRYEELKSWSKLVSNSTYSINMIDYDSNDYYMKLILEILNKEYFDNTLKIEWKEYTVTINNEIRNNTIQLLEYLQNLYDLECIKRKIENIYETN